VAGQQAIERVGEGLPVGLAERRRSPGVNAARQKEKVPGLFSSSENRPGTFSAPFRPMALLFIGLFRKKNRLPVTERLGHHQPLRLSLDERLLTANSGYLLR
jgi:hypothetical protein